MKSGPDGSPEGIRASVEEAFRVLGGTKTVDIFECARVDPKTPIETSIKALAELVKEGKIGGIGLSEASASTIRKAHAIHPISAVEIELSLFTPDVLHNGIADTCHERKLYILRKHEVIKPPPDSEIHATVSIPIVAYSPVGRSILTGEISKLDDLPQNDFRRMLSRFKPEVFDQNLKLVNAVGQIAKRKGVTTAQVAIGWVCRQGAIPIPGSTKANRVTENCKPASLSDEDMAEIQKILDTMPAAGERYGGVHENLLNG